MHGLQACFAPDCVLKVPSGFGKLLTPDLTDSPRRHAPRDASTSQDSRSVVLLGDPKQLPRKGKLENRRRNFANNEASQNLGSALSKELRVG